MAEIRIEHLQKTFGDFTAVRDSTFTVRNGEFFCLLGPSGCGKTTTLRMIAGLELPTSGRILLGGDDVTFKRASQRDIAFVFQLFALYPHMNVRTNIGYPLRSQGMLRHDVQARVAEAARILRIEHLLNRITLRPADLLDCIDSQSGYRPNHNERRPALEPWDLKQLPCRLRCAPRPTRSADLHPRSQSLSMDHRRSFSNPRRT